MSVGTFFQVEGGMDRPWRLLASQMEVRTGVRVERVAEVAGGVEIRAAGVTEPFDGAVVAVPAPVAAVIVAGEALPEAVRAVEYAPHVRVYAARRGPGHPRAGVHAFPNDTVATVEFGRGGEGSWGRLPPGWEWALLCAPAASSAGLLGLPDAELAQRMWEVGIQIEPRLFDLASAEIVHVVRWPYAVPKFRPGHFARLARIEHRPPIVFAGDWLVQPCVEGAVRSGLIAASRFGSA
jgi:predicted NAD/FAD-dependent oxidoreductase